MHSRLFFAALPATDVRYLANSIDRPVTGLGCGLNRSTQHLASLWTGV